VSRLESLIIFLVFAVISILRTVVEQQSKQTKKTPGTTQTAKPRSEPRLPRWLTPEEPAGKTAKRSLPVKPRQEKAAQKFRPPNLLEGESFHFEEETAVPATAPVSTKIKPAAGKLQPQTTLFHNLDEVGRAIVLAEIVGKPKALRKFL